MTLIKKVKSKTVALLLAVILTLTVGITSVSATPSTVDEIAPITTTECVTENTNNTTPDEANESSGSKNYGFWLGIGAVVIGGLVATAVIGIKAKKDEDEED